MKDQDLINAQAALVNANHDETMSYYALAASIGLLNAQNLKLTALDLQ